MSLDEFIANWRRFWFTPSTPEPIAIFRILYGILVLQILTVSIGSDWLTWYGSHSLVSIDAIRSHFWQNQPRFDLLLAFQTDEAKMYYFYSLCLAAFCLTIGLGTRLTAVYVVLSLISMQHHMPFNNNGGDSFVKLTGIFLACSNAGDCYSVDRLLAKMKDPTLPVPVKSQWAMRMIQIQLCIAYWHTFCCKISGEQWWNGTAVYYASRLQDLQRFPLPIADNLLMCRLLTWFTLVIEFSLWTLIWIKEFRYFVLAAALMLHLGIDYSINLPVFEWAFIFALVTFVEPHDVRKAVNFITGKFRKFESVSQLVITETVKSNDDLSAAKATNGPATNDTLLASEQP